MTPKERKELFLDCMSELTIKLGVWLDGGNIILAPEGSGYDGYYFDNNQGTLNFYHR